MKYYIYADSHCGHQMLTERCGRPEGFTGMVLRNVANVCVQGTVLIHLGDVCMKNDASWNEALRQAVGGKMWLIKGNHDRRGTSWYLDHGWDFVADSMTLNMFGHTILFSHVPKPLPGYTVNVHGHFHDNDHRSHEPELVAVRNNQQALLAIEHTNYQPVELGSFIERWSKMKMPAVWWTHHHPSCGEVCNPDLCPKHVYEKTGKWVGPKYREKITEESYE